MTVLDPQSTALVLIDIQNGILGLPLMPRDGAETLAACKYLATRFRAAGALVVPVRVDFGPDFVHAPPGQVDFASS